MKKLMKVLALATAICMLMSVSAFAADSSSAVIDETNTKLIDITIATGAADNEEVAVLIVTAGSDLAALDDEDIMYINQVTSANGAYSLGDVALLADGEVDIWIGSTAVAAGNSGAAKKIATLDTSYVAPSESLTINTIGGAKFKTYSSDALDTDVEGGTGVAISLDYDVDSAIEYVIWSLSTANGKKYSKSIAVTDTFGVIDNDGTIQLSAAFSNGRQGVEAVEITGVNIIVKTAGGTVLFTDELNDKDAEIKPEV